MTSCADKFESAVNNKVVATIQPVTVASCDPTEPDGGTWGRTIN